MRERVSLFSTVPLQRVAGGASRSLLVLLCLSACSLDRSTAGRPAPSVDAGPLVDAGSDPRDAGLDAGDDAGPPGEDGGSLDAGRDAGPLDAGPFDAGCADFEEPCNGVDDDCDPDTPDEPVSNCDSDDPDRCNDDVRECVDGEYACVDVATDLADICDGADNDCDPTTEDGSADPMLGAECDGDDTDVCVSGRFTCVSGALFCDEPESFLESCNGVDDDCDGAVEEGACDSDCTVVTESDRVYLFCTDTRRWSGARDWCSDRSYHLVSIADAAEQGFLDSLLPDSGEWWMGLHDRCSGCEGDFRWDDGTPLGHTNWSGGEPNNFFDEDCGMLFSDGTWNDADCGEEHFFICEYP